MAVDLHTHSTMSDGSDPPTRVVELAIDLGLTALALTDHDGLGGIDAAAEAADGHLDFIPGVELSVGLDERAAHLLAYWIAPGTPLAETLDAIQRNRVERNHEMVAALVDLGIDITHEELEAEAKEGVIGRPHIAAVLVRKGVVESIAQAFDEYLAAGRPAYRGRLRLGIEEAIGLTKASGAVAVIAHPHTIADDAESFGELFERLASLGIEGVECYYSEYDDGLRQRLATHARSLGMVPTGGSDYHGTYKPTISLGIGKGDLVVPDSVVPELRDRVAK